MLELGCENATVGKNEVKKENRHKFFIENLGLVTTTVLDCPREVTTSSRYFDEDSALRKCVNLRWFEAPRTGLNASFSVPSRFLLHGKNLHRFSETLASLGIMGDQLRASLTHLCPPLRFRNQFCIVVVFLVYALREKCSNINDTFKRVIGTLVNWHISTRVFWRV